MTKGSAHDKKRSGGGWRCCCCDRFCACSASPSIDGSGGGKADNKDGSSQSGRDDLVIGIGVVSVT